MIRYLKRLTCTLLIGSVLGSAPTFSAAQEPVHYTNVLRIDPARTDEFLAFIREAAKATRAFEGCRYFAILVDEGDPSLVLFYEIWDSKEDHQAYRAWRAETGFTQLISPFIRGTESHYYSKVDD